MVCDAVQGIQHNLCDVVTVRLLCRPDLPCQHVFPFLLRDALRRLKIRQDISNHIRIIRKPFLSVFLLETGLDQVFVQHRLFRCYAAHFIALAVVECSRPGFALRLARYGERE